MQQLWLALVFSSLWAVGSISPDFDSGMAAYERGDYTLAANHWQNLAEDGDPRAQYYLATLYVHGQGVPRDDALAAHWFRAAAEQGHTIAQYDTGKTVAAVHETSTDHPVQTDWHRRAAERGDPVAQYSLGFMYEEGRGVPQDYVMAHMWFSLSAKRGYEPARAGRDYCASHLSERQLAKSRRLASRWTPRADSLESQITSGTASPAASARSLP